jgi:hypothetical protein
MAVPFIAKDVAPTQVDVSTSLRPLLQTLVANVCQWIVQMTQFRLAFYCLRKLSAVISSVSGLHSNAGEVLFVRLEVSTVVNTKNAVFWDIKPSSYLTANTLHLRYKTQPDNAV